MILNAAPARPLDPKVATNVDILVVNAVEAEMMCGVAVASLTAAAEAARLAIKPSRQRSRHGRRPEPRDCGVRATASGHAAHGVSLVDTHGAGDAFIGALAARLIDRSSLLKHSLCQCRGSAFCQHTS